MAAAADAVGRSVDGLSPDVGFAIGLVVTLVLLVLVVVVLMLVSFWKIFKKAEQPGWAAFVPVYNTVKLLEVTMMPLWFIVFLIVPVANIFVSVMMAYRLAKVFGKGAWFTVGLIFLPFIFYPILGFGKATYMPRAVESGISEAAKWTVIGGAALGAIYYLLLMFAAFAGGGSSAPGLMTIAGSGGYATDGTNVYENDQLIPGADPSSFEAFGDYALDSTAVYYQGTVLFEANPLTFVVPDGSSGGYAYDDAYVWYDGETIKGADPATFEELDPDYAMDASHVWYDGVVIPGADSSTFATASGTIGNHSYDAKDKNHYYSYGELVR